VISAAGADTRDSLLNDGLLVYFVGAIVSHVRVRDVNGRPAAFMLIFSAPALLLRVLAHKAGHDWIGAPGSNGERS
jgi:hypothetical protein